MAQRKGPAPRKGEVTRRQILDAAIDRFGRDGYRNTSIADIARDAGLSGTAAYAYFPNKEALFLAAVDEDAAAVVHVGLDELGKQPALATWRETMVFALVDAIDQHPLARRLLAGLEPDVTARVLEVPALAELRKACAEQIRAEQVAGTVRSDIDPASVGNGVVAIVLSLLMSVVQLGNDTATAYSADVATVFEAALAPTPLR